MAEHSASYLVLSLAPCICSPPGNTDCSQSHRTVLTVLQDCGRGRQNCMFLPHSSLTVCPCVSQTPSDCCILFLFPSHLEGQLHQHNPTWKSSLQMIGGNSRACALGREGQSWRGSLYRRAACIPACKAAKMFCGRAGRRVTLLTEQFHQ